MKKVTFAALAALTITACSSGPKFQVNGDVSGADGKMLYLEASGLEVIAVSNADVTSVSRENGIELKLTVVVKPVITIEGYKGIEATKKNVEVTDEDVSAEFVKVQDRNSRMVDVDNRGALTGDTAVIDFEGFCDGKAFEGGKAEGFELSLGSGQFIPGLSLIHI